MMKRPLLSLFVFLALKVAEGIVSDYSSKDYQQDNEKAFRFVVLPDTQVYSATKAFGDQDYKVTNPEGKLPIFNIQTQWIVDHAKDLNIKYVTRHGSEIAEWEHADEAMSILGHGGIPFWDIHWKS